MHRRNLLQHPAPKQLRIQEKPMHEDPHIIQQTVLFQGQGFNDMSAPSTDSSGFGTWCS